MTIERLDTILDRVVDHLLAIEEQRRNTHPAEHTTHPENQD